jgi:Tfp pilus assembly protein PilN
MMKNMVNLYHPEFHPKLQLLTLSSVVVSWTFAALVCSLLYFFVAAKQQNFKSEMANIEQTKQQQQILVQELQNAVDNQNLDPALLKQLEKNQLLINVKKRMLNKLSGQENLKSSSFSKLMIELATYNPSELWLTHISVYGMNVLIEGQATDSAIVPKRLSSLGQTDYFRGQEFSNTRLYRDSEQQINFVISTDTQLPIENTPPPIENDSLDE